MKKIKFNKRNYIRNYSELIEWFSGMDKYFTPYVMSCANFLSSVLFLPSRSFCDDKMKLNIMTYTAVLEESQARFMNPGLPVNHFVFVFDIFK